MLNQIGQFFTKAVKTPSIRKKLIITGIILIVFRLAGHIPAAGIDKATLAALFAGSPLLSLLDVFSGGTLANFSILALGLNPYINASIIFQLLGYVIPSIEELQKEGEFGQEKINQYTRLLTVPLAALQGFGMYALLRGQKSNSESRSREPFNFGYNYDGGNNFCRLAWRINFRVWFQKRSFAFDFYRNCGQTPRNFRSIG